MADSIAKFLNWVSPDLPKNDDKQYIGVGGFRMFVAISEGTNFSASAPDIVCEDLTTVQDSIINAPKTFSLTGEVADIFIETTPETEKVLNKATPYLPARTLSQIQKIKEQAGNIENVIDSATSFAKTAGDIYDLVGDKSVLANTKSAVDAARGAFDDLVGSDSLTSGIENLFDKISSSKPPSVSIKDEFFSFIERTYDSKSIISIENKSRAQQKVLITGFSYTETNDGDTGDFTMTFKEIRITDISLFRDSQKLSDGEKAKVKVNTTLQGQLESSIDKGLSDGIKVVQDKAVQVFSSIGLDSAAGFIGGL